MTSIISDYYKEQFGYVGDYVVSFESTRAALEIHEKFDQASRLERKLEQAMSNSGLFLSSAVIEIRAAVRAGLNGEITQLNDLAKTQADRIADLLKPVVDEVDSGEENDGSQLLLGSHVVSPYLVEEQREMSNRTSRIRATYEACTGAES